MRVEIAIKTYDDLFSNFDMRKFDERYFSSDFLNELRMRTRHLLGRKDLEIVLGIPEIVRNREVEAIIAERLGGFFLARLERDRRKAREILLRSILLEAVGVAFLLVANILSRHAQEYFKEFLLIPSWFFVWNGLEKYIFNKKVLDRKVKHYAALSRARIAFEGVPREG